MARPRTVRAFGGEVIIRNLPKDKQDIIAAYVEAFAAKGEAVVDAEQVVQAVEAAPAEEKHEVIQELVNPEEMPHTALGIHQENDGSFQFVEVVYNSQSGNAKVDKVRKFSKLDRTIALSEFRIQAARKFMV